MKFAPANMGGAFIGLAHIGQAFRMSLHKEDMPCELST